MNTETRGTLSRRGNISQITNAFVEEVNAFSNTSTGYIIVSYAASPGQQSDNIQMLRLNINRNTVILDSSGQVISLSEIRPQTWINAVFSSAMTRSIPPQANAFLIMVQKRRPQIEIATSIGRIASIDAANGFLYTGNPNDINSQVRYVVSNSTFSDPSGRPITLSSLRPRQRCRLQVFTGVWGRLRMAVLCRCRRGEQRQRRQLHYNQPVRFFHRQKIQILRLLLLLLL